MWPNTFLPVALDDEEWSASGSFLFTRKGIEQTRRMGARLVSFPAGSVTTLTELSWCRSTL
jgi:hypothetical protein